MKKYVLSLLMVMTTTLAAFGQSFVSEHGDTADVTGFNNDINVYNHLKAVSGTVYIKWKVVGYNFAPGWNFTGFCDNNLCYPVSSALLNGFSTQTSFPYNATSWGDFHANFDGSAAAPNSSSWIQVFATDTVANYSKTYTFIVRKGTLGVTSVQKVEDDVTLYPNPANNNVNVVFDASLNVKNAAIYNLIGKIVKIYKVSGNSAKLDINDIPSGIYFVRLMNAQGQIVATRKFTHQ